MRHREHDLRAAAHGPERRAHLYACMHVCTCVCVCMLWCVPACMRTSVPPSTGRERWAHAEQAGRREVGVGDGRIDDCSCEKEAERHGAHRRRGRGFAAHLHAHAHMHMGAHMHTCAHMHIGGTGRGRQHQAGASHAPWQRSRTRRPRARRVHSHACVHACVERTSAALTYWAAEDSLAPNRHCSPASPRSLACVTTCVHVYACVTTCMHG